MSFRQPSGSCCATVQWQLLGLSLVRSRIMLFDCAFWCMQLLPIWSCWHEWTGLLKPWGLYKSKLRNSWDSQHSHLTRVWCEASLILIRGGEQITKMAILLPLQLKQFASFSNLLRSHWKIWAWGKTLMWWHIVTRAMLTLQNIAFITFVMAWHCVCCFMSSHTTGLMSWFGSYALPPFFFQLWHLQWMLSAFTSKDLRLEKIYWQHGTTVVLILQTIAFITFVIVRHCAFRVSRHILACSADLVMLCFHSLQLWQL